LILHLRSGLRLCKVLCDGLILRLGGLLTHPKLCKQRGTVKLTACDGLTKLLGLCSVSSLLSGKSLLKVLTHGLICHLLCALALRKILGNGAVDCILRSLSGLERCHLRFTAKFTCRQTLCKLLRLRLVRKLT
jgi:hypothetical protein